MSSQESQLAGVIAKDLHGCRPESSRLFVRTTLGALFAGVFDLAQMPDHRVVPFDKLLRKGASLRRADTITKNPVHVHVIPLSLFATRTTCAVT